MIIEKVLNNNLLLTRNTKGKEVIVMGKGISFQKSAGDEVDEHKIDKIFHLAEHAFAVKMAELIHELPAVHFEVVNEIVKHANHVLGTELSDNIYLSLTDHISFAIQRKNKGMEIKNAMLFEIKRFYKTEFSIGLDALQLIRDMIGVSLGEDEAGFIALHVVNARLDGTEMKLTIKMTEIVNEILKIVTYHYGTVLDEASLNYSRFLTHLQYFAMRLLRHEIHQSGEDFLYQQVKKTYVRAFSCTCKINEYLEKTYVQSLNKDEFVYLTIHIQRLTERSTL